MWAIVPYKRVEVAKRRLAPVLTFEERRRLSRAMLEDVLATLAATPSLAGVLVVTRDSQAEIIARYAGAEVLGEHGPTDHSGAVAQGIAALEAKGERSMVVVPADVPLATPDELTTIAGRQTGPRSITIVPSLDGNGTNAFACLPSRIIRPQFGVSSFARHHAAARAAGIEPAVLDLPGFALDIDTAQDLREFLARPSNTRTYGYLANSRIAERLGTAAGPGAARPRWR